MTYYDVVPNSTWAPLVPGDIHCNPGALTDTFGFLIQLSLGAIAFCFLVIKRYCEPKLVRRSWWIWSFDTSKQIIASFVTHFGNIALASLAGDPCSWYFINFAVDSTVGLVIIFLGLRFSNYIIDKYDLTSLRSGEYGTVGFWPRLKAWIGQCFVYILIASVEKAITASFMVAIWKPMQNLVIWPHVNPKLEVAVVLLIVPFVVNVIVFWVIDNLLMRQQRKKALTIISQPEPLSAPSGETTHILGVPQNFDSQSDTDYEPLIRTGNTPPGASTFSSSTLAV